MLITLLSHQVYEKVAYLLTNLGEPQPSLSHVHAALCCLLAASQLVG